MRRPPRHFPIVSHRRRGAAGRRHVSALGALFFLVAAAAVWLLGLRVFAPRPYLEPPRPDYSYDPRPMQQAVDWRAVQARQEAIVGLGSRFMGQPGVYAAEALIRDAFLAAGLELHEQENWTVVPRTIRREIALAEDEGTTLPDVEIFPFMPNHLQPVATPDEGVTGELLVLTPEVLRTRERFDDCIGLVDASPGRYSPDYEFAWGRYAQLGLRALIVSHPEGLDQVPLERVVPWQKGTPSKGGMVSSMPVNFVRVAATPAIFDYAGRRVTLRVNVRFEETRNTSLVGILRAPGTSRERPNTDALVILSNYDAASILPDRAPGVIQAISPAAQLALLEGFTAYRDSLVRDVIFIACGAQMMARAGDENLLRLLDENIYKATRNPVREILGLGAAEAGADAQAGARAARLQPWRERHEENEAALRRTERILALFENDGFLSEPGPTLAALAQLDEDDAAFLRDQVDYVLDTLAFEQYEAQLQAKLVFLTTGENLHGPEFAAFQEARRRYDRAVAVGGRRLENLFAAESGLGDFLNQHDLRRRWRARFEELRAYHQRRRRQLTLDLDVLAALNPYQQFIIFDNKLVPAFHADRREEVLTFSNGDWSVSAQMRAMASLFVSARQRLAAFTGNADLRRELEIPRLAKYHNQDVDRNTQPVSDRSSVMWMRFGYLNFTLLNFDRQQSYEHWADPTDRPFMHDVASLRHSLAVVGENLLSIAHGNGKLAAIQVGWLKRTFGGRVLADGIGQSLVPDYPLAGAVLANRTYLNWETYAFPGYYDHILIMTDPYGRYELVNSASDFWVSQNVWANGYSPLAAWHDRNGFIRWMKDEGEDGQRLYKSVKLNWFDAKVDNITLVCFRAAPVAFFDLTNPQTLRDYSGLRLFSRDGLAEFRKRCLYETNAMRMAWLDPEARFYAALESGSPENELVKEIRGFLLGVPRAGEPSDFVPDPDREIDGPGYLAAATPVMQGLPFEMGESMTFLNGRRLEVQNRHRMADPRTNDYHAKARGLLAESAAPELPWREKILLAREAVTYAMLNHPVLRRSLFEAVLGIIWYLALLVPFTFFFEKMVFGYSDVRKQIAAQIIIFLVAFGLLRVLHPAFGMVRSSVMILLGFVVILISTGMTILFSGKFKENLEELKKRRGQVEAAQINRLGVIGSAFMLGLNNMHRRKVRTGLTCGTLTLITFAMIAFTSVHSDVVDEATALGKAGYQGILIKNEHFKRISDAELFAITERYGDRYQVNPRRMYLGQQNWQDTQGYNPELVVLYETDGRRRAAQADSLMQMSAGDPLRDQIRLLTDRGWFTPADEASAELPAAILPDRMAERLGLTAAEVNTGDVQVQINGRAFRVRGIFESRSLAEMRDLDGRDLLPYDIEAMAHIQLQEGEVVATDADPRIDPARIILAPQRELNLQVPNGIPAIVSVAVAMPQAGYAEARAEIDDYLEQTGKTAFYGLEGVAWRGRRAREASFEGLIELLIPLILAALTVLNTMKGSVYERRDEIFVYNAVGIAPRYVFFMFIAEAFVYSVVGTVLGYLLSQGVGRILTELDLTGGLNMTYTSINTIYASLAVAAAVFISTWFPARAAMEIARPAEEAGWSLPEPDGDDLRFDLPFNFDHRDRIAVLAFCERWLADHGEGGGGRFHASVPELGVEQPSAAGDDDYLPAIRATIWPKPFDLGVSQRLEIVMTPDPETGEFKAGVRLERLTGTREAWLRLNKAFVADLRRHFLHWRAVDESDRRNLFDEARDHILTNLGLEHA
ncbi:MAG TPA: ABC transporter permease [Candidatus Sumerlaeota bacterium]|nr:ABC transporter permease [Candidatus Sumerlaeota bacterium]